MADRERASSTVHLTRIYTRTGDDGTTALGDMSRVRKTAARVVAYGDVDEANSAIGVAVATGELPEDVAALLTRIQNELFDVGADLCSPIVEAPKWAPLRIDEGYVEDLEQACDDFNARLEPLNSFILPGRTPAAAALHVARSRDASRRASGVDAARRRAGRDQPAVRDLPEPAVRPAVHPGPGRQRHRR